MPIPNPIEEARKAVERAVETERRNKRFIESVGPAITESLRSIIVELMRAISIIPIQVKKAVSDKIEVNPEFNVPRPKVTVNVPETKLPEFPAIPPIKVPRPKVTVNTPEIKFPKLPTPKVTVKTDNSLLIKEIKSVTQAISAQEIVFPEHKSIFDEVSLGFTKPLPVIQTDSKGKPIIIADSGSGGNSNVFVKEIYGTSGASMANADNRLRVSLETGGSGLTDNELRAAHLAVKQLSGTTDSVNVVDAYGSTSVSSVWNADNRLRVSLETGGSGLTDNELRAAGVEVKQTSGFTDSVNVVDAFGSTAVDSMINADNRLRVSLETGGSGLTDSELRASGVPVSQVSGATWSTSVTSFPDNEPFDMAQVAGTATSVDEGVSGAGVQRVVMANDVLSSVAVKEIWGSSITTLLNGDNRLPVSLETGGSGLTDNELRAAHLDVKQLSGITDSVNVLDAFGSTSVSSVWNADNRLRVSLETGGSGLTDSELRASHLGVKQLSGSVDSVIVNEIFGSVAANVVNPDGRLKVEQPTGATGLTDTELRASRLDVKQVSGSVDSVVVNSGTITAVTDITNSISVQQVDADNNYRDSFPVEGTLTAVTDITNSVAVYNLDADGNYRDVVPVIAQANSGVDIGDVTVTDITASTTAIIGDKRADEADGDSNPVKIGGVARTANPTAVAAGDRVSATYDDVGRSIQRPLQVRDLMATAYATLSTGTETTLLSAGGAGVYHDLVYVMGANTSDSAIQVDLRDVTAGNVITTIEIPSGGTAGISLPVPIPQGNPNNNWTADMADVSNTTLYISGLFSKEV